MKEKIYVELDPNERPISVTMEDAETAKEVAIYMAGFMDGAKVSEHQSSLKLHIGKAVAKKYTNLPLIQDYGSFFNMTTSKIRELTGIEV